MKNYMKNLALALSVALFAGIFSANAQQKMGYVDLQSVMLAMPEYKAADDSMRKFNEALENELEMLSQEFQSEYEKFDREMKDGKLSPPMQEIRKKNLQKMQQNIQEYQQQAQAQSDERKSDLLKPLIDKAKNAIQQVAKETGYSYVFDSNTAGILYKPEGDDLTPVVKKKLGVTDSPVAPAGPKGPAPTAPRR